MMNAPDEPQDPSPADARFPDNYPDATGKGDLHIPGAGTFGMAVLIASLTMLFVASMVALLVVRSRQATWPPAHFPPLPRSLWFSTIIIPFASLTVQLAHNAIRRDNDRALRRWLLATLIVGLLFLAMQTLNWLEYFQAVRHIDWHGPYANMFYILTALHAAHVVGGLIPLIIVYIKAHLGRYSRNFHPGVRYLSIYWHFLDIIWLILFAVLYL